MIAICYTGDKRFNYKLTHLNHKKLFEKLSQLGEIKEYWFTKDLPIRGICPYDENLPDMASQGKYRRGQGGAVQAWDFLNAVRHVDEDIVIRMRSDTWFDDSAIDIIYKELESILKGEQDFIFFGSDLINKNAGKEFDKRFIDTESSGKVQDFVIAANKKNIMSMDDVCALIDNLSVKKRGSGNKVFRFCIKPGSKAFSVICKIYLIRKFYNEEPSELVIFKDYLESYGSVAKTPELQHAYEWLESQKS